MSQYQELVKNLDDEAKHRATASCGLFGPSSTLEYEAARAIESLEAEVGKLTKEHSFFRSTCRTYGDSPTPPVQEIGSSGGGEDNELTARSTASSPISQDGSIDRKGGLSEGE